MIDGMSAGEVLELLQAHLILSGWSESNAAALSDSLLHAPPDVTDRAAWVDAAIIAKCAEYDVMSLTVNPSRRNTRPGVCAVCGDMVAAGAGRWHWREGLKRQTWSGVTYYEGGEDLVCDECTKETTNG